MDSLDYLNSMDTRRYKCCRGQIHVGNGAVIAATLELFIDFSIFFVFITDVCFGSHLIPGTTLIIVLTLCLLHGSTACLIFYAQRRQNHLALVPHLCAQIFVLLSSIGVLAFSLVVLALNYFLVERDAEIELRRPDVTDFRMVFSLFAGSLATVLQMWFLNVTVKFYRFLKAKTRYYRFLDRISSILPTEIED